MKAPSRLIILLAGLVLCTVCGVLYAWSIFVVPLEQAFGWQRPETSLTFTFMITFFSLGMFAGESFSGSGPPVRCRSAARCCASGCCGRRASAP